MSISSMNRSLLSAICLLIAVFSRGVDGTAFVFENMTCDSPVNIYVESVTCGSSSSNTCTFGDVLHATGTLGLSSSLKYSSMCSTVKARFLNSTVISQTYDIPIDVCDDLGLKSMDGTACPGAADYYFDTKFQLPGQGSYTLGSGWWIIADIALANCGSDVPVVKCYAKFAAVSTAESKTTSGAVLFGVGVLVYAIARKRRVATIDLNKEEQLLEGNFEMMPEQIVQA